MNLNTLYLTATNSSAIHLTLDAYGMNYKKINLPITDELLLESDDHALYNAIVIEEATKDQLQNIHSQIMEYQKKYKVRVAYLNCEPGVKTGFSSTSKKIGVKYVQLTDEGIAFAKKYQINGEDIDFRVPNHESNGKFYHYNVKIKDEAIMPILKFNDTETYAAALDTRNHIESIHFFVGNSDSALTYFNSHLWIPWINHGIIDGFRRLYFGIQIDDYFINNPYNKTVGTEFRTSVQDMKNLAVWQKDILTRMPKGSQFKIELALNGMYILSIAKHKCHVTQKYTSVVKPYDYVKPLDKKGTQKWPETVDSDWDDAILIKRDKLYNYFAKNETSQDDFYWLTHTFSHHNLNYASFHDADMEIALNIKITDEPYLGMYKRNCYSPHSIVCPEISGLHNGDALKAFEKHGIHFAVGDTSRPDLASGNPYLPVLTNQTFANYDGFVIIPRQPTGMYWDCSTADQILKLHKQRTGNDVDWNSYVKKDIEEKVVNFVKMRHDPYMFHEGNLRNEDFDEMEIHGVKGKFGLMQQWVEHMVVEIRKYFDWPLITIKMDELGQTFLDKVERNQCQPVYTMDIDETTYNIKEINVSSTTGKCKVPLLAIRDTGFDKSTVDAIEQYGDEPETAWIEVTDTTPKSIKFEKTMNWDENVKSVQTIADDIEIKNKNVEVASDASSFITFTLFNVILMINAMLFFIF